MPIWAPLLVCSLPFEDIFLPAHTAYSEPNPEAIETEGGAPLRWQDPKSSVVFYGGLRESGAVTYHLRLAEASPNTKLRMRVAGGTRTLSATSTELDFGTFTAPKGKFRAQIDLVSGPAPQISGLALSGDPIGGAMFNLKERRNAASVHLAYQTPADAKIDAFYAEAKAETDPIYTYYMATGFRRGYFGMQVNSPTERRIIFSIWDAGNEAVDRDKVSDDDRVKLVAKGPDVNTGDFGNEGTGGHSHLKYPWKTGDRNRFLVTVSVDGSHTTYSGYYYFNDKHKWGLISSWRAPKDGNYLAKLYSFNECFGGSTGQMERRCRFGNQWIHIQGQGWVEVDQAKFSHDGTGKADRLDYAAGNIGSDFYLQNGGFKFTGIKYGDLLTRKSTQRPPADLPLGY